MREEIIEKVFEIHDFLDFMKLNDLKEMIVQFHEKLLEEFYLEFLKQLQELLEKEYSYDDFIRALDVTYDEFVGVLYPEVNSSFGQLYEELRGCRDNVKIAKSMLQIYLDKYSKQRYTLYKK